MKPIESFFYIPIHLFFWFQFTLSSHITISSYPKLEHTFRKFTISGSELRHPYSQEIVNDLLRVCREIPQARMYQLLVPDQVGMAENLDLSYCSMIAQSTIHYENIRITINNTEYNVPMLQCLKTANGEYIHAAAGLSAYVNFLFVQKGEESDLSVYGLAEFTPIFDEEFHNQRFQQMYFIRIQCSSSSTFAVNDTLCTLNEQQKFRLCNLINDVQQVVLETEEQTSQQNEPTGYSQLPQIYYAIIISCYKNQTNQFFLTINPFDENSVVTLSRAKKEIDILTPFEAKRIFVAKDRYRDVSVLKYRTIFV